MEERARRRPYRLRVVEVNRRRREDHSRRACGVRGSQDRSRVPRVAHLVQEGHASRAAEIVHRRVDERRHADQALGGDGPCEATHHVLAHLDDLDPRLPGAHSERIQRVRHEQLLQCARRREGLAHRLGTLGEEPAVLLSERALVQPQRGLDLGVLRRRQQTGPPARELRRAESTCAEARGGNLAASQAAVSSAAFDVAINCSNALGSFTARSARIFRSTSTSATFKPFMNRL